MHSISDLGHLQRFEHAPDTSAVHLQADIRLHRSGEATCRFNQVNTELGEFAVVAVRPIMPERSSLLDYLIGSDKEALRHGDAKCLGADVLANDV